MKYKGFYDIEQMKRYLRRSVIRLKDTPIYITEVEQEVNRAGDLVDRLKYVMIGEDARTKSILVSSNRVNLAPVPLGLLNYGEGEYSSCHVISRIPARLWKFGLSTHNMHVGSVGGNGTDLAVGDIICSRYLRNTILNAYPVYERACQLAEAGGIYTTIAFSRHFAVQKKRNELSLTYYKYQESVGTCMPGRMRLNNSFHFLQEHLDGVMQ
jgi:hypothetical protein